MKASLEVTGTELMLLYLMTGNKDAGHIVLTTAGEYARAHRQKKKPGRPIGWTAAQATNPETRAKEQK